MNIVQRIAARLLPGEWIWKSERGGYYATGLAQRYEKDAAFISPGHHATLIADTLNEQRERCSVLKSELSDTEKKLDWARERIRELEEAIENFDDVACQMREVARKVLPKDEDPSTLF